MTLKIPSIEEYLGKIGDNASKRRWPIVSERKPQHLRIKKSQAGNEEILTAWFEKVKEVLAKNGLTIEDDEEISARLWNCDETAFCTSVSS